jgi:4-amino-4-deoxy-L-arabinose transferase-like glycosyltransferase
MRHTGHTGTLTRRGVPKDSRVWRDILVLIMALSVWFGYELGDRSLWDPDEGRYSEIPREMVATGDYITPRLNGVKYFEKPVLYYWMQAGAIKLFGASEWSLRLWSAFLAGLGCLAVYYAGYRLFGRSTGLFAAAILATSVWYDLMGSAITLDMAVTAFLTLALLAFLLGTRAPPGLERRLWLYAFYVLAAAATLTKGLIGIVIPGMVIFAWIAVTRQWSLLRSLYLPTGTLLFFAIAAPWHVMVSLANPEFPWFYFVHEHFARFLTTVHHRSEPIWFFAPVLLVGMFPWSAFFFEAVRRGLKDRHSGERTYADTWFLLLWAGLVFAFFSMSGSKLATYILPAMPPLAILCGRYFADMWERCMPQTANYPYWLMLVAALLAGPALILIRWFVSGNQKIMDIYNMIGRDLYLIVASVLALAIVPFILKRSSGNRHGIVALFLTTALMVLSFDVIVDKVDVTRTVKPLAMEVKRLAKPGDEVVSYLDYFQDLPDYLGHTVTVAGWKGELEFGSEQEDTSGWMIDEPEVASRLRRETMYIITRDRNIDRLKALSPVPLHVIMRAGRDVLVTNAVKIL